jgi:hypothetical protein
MPCKDTIAFREDRRERREFCEHSSVFCVIVCVCSAVWSTHRTYFSNLTPHTPSFELHMGGRDCGVRGWVSCYIVLRQCRVQDRLIVLTLIYCRCEQTGRCLYVYNHVCAPGFSSVNNKVMVNMDRETLTKYHSKYIKYHLIDDLHFSVPIEQVVLIDLLERILSSC